MKANNNIHPEINQKDFLDFIKLSQINQAGLLKATGVKLDSDIENDKRVNLFYLGGFFVEEIRAISDNSLLEIIPFKNGYRLENYVEVKEVFVPKNGIMR